MRIQYIHTHTRVQRVSLVALYDDILCSFYIRMYIYIYNTCVYSQSLQLSRVDSVNYAAAKRECSGALSHAARGSKSTCVIAAADPIDLRQLALCCIYTDWKVRDQ